MRATLFGTVTSVSSNNINMLYAIRFNADIKSKLYAGQAYKQDIDLGDGWLEYIYKPAAGGQYVISVDDGGAHVWLYGHAVSDGRSLAAGNMSFVDTNGAGAQHNVSIAASDYVDVDTWHHFAVGYDASADEIRCYVDGVSGYPIAVTADYRRQITDSGVGEIHIGGSHHQTASGDLLAMAIYEGIIPTSANTLPASFRPSRYLGYATQDAAEVHTSPSMMWNFTYPSGRIIPDLGYGYNSARHNAVMHADYNVAGTYSGVYGDLVHATGFPEWVVVTDFAKPAYAGAAHSGTVGAIVSDTFSRDDSTPFWDDSIGLGSAPTGQAWSSTEFGIIDGAAYVKTWGSNYRATVPTAIAESAGYVNMRVEATRKIATATGGNIGVVARYTDESNYLFLITDNTYTRAFLYKVVAGVSSSVKEISGLSATYAKIALNCNGSSIKTYVDDVLVDTSTVTDNATGTKAGLYGEGFLRCTKFEVLTAT